MSKLVPLFPDDDNVPRAKPVCRPNSSLEIDLKRLIDRSNPGSRMETGRFDWVWIIRFRPTILQSNLMCFPTRSQKEYQKNDRYPNKKPETQSYMLIHIRLLYRITIISRIRTPANSRPDDFDREVNEFVGLDSRFVRAVGSLFPTI